MDDRGIAWTSEALVYADNDGIIDLVSAASTRGTYQGVDASGLFWSMMPVPPGELDTYRKEMPKHPERTAAPTFDEPGERELRIWAERDGRELAAALYRQRRIAADVEVRTVRDGRLRGVLYRPKGGSDGRPALIWMMGSGGGVDSRYAPLLASRGYTVLALGYFGYADLPAASHNLPIEYFGEALDWMARETGRSRTVVVGMSRGSEAALLTGSFYPDKVAGVVAFAPSHVVNNGIDDKGNVAVPNWTWQGKPLPFAQAPFPDTATWLTMSDWTFLREIFVSTGGTPALNAAASRQAWSELLRFPGQVDDAEQKSR